MSDDIKNMSHEELMMKLRQGIKIFEIDEKNYGSPQTLLVELLSRLRRGEEAIKELDKLKSEIKRLVDKSQETHLVYEGDLVKLIEGKP